MKKNRGKQRCKSRLQEIKMKMFDRNFRNKRKKFDEINERKKMLNFQTLRTCTLTENDKKKIKRK
jgi:hypothetical protein